MAVPRRHPNGICVQGTRTWRRTPRPSAVATLSFVFLAVALAAGKAPGQGCARCGAPAASPSAAHAVLRPNTVFVERKRRYERWTIKTSLKFGTQPRVGGGYTICVRTCDGSFFPVSYFGADSRSDTLEQVCRSLCPNADVALYSFPFGGTVDEAVSSTGEPYASLPNAHKFEQSYDSSCSCRAPGQSWAEALAAAEAKYGRHSHDIYVTVKDAERMSRPVRDPTAKPTAADPGQSAVEPAPGLDINGVDTTLSAATRTISRETAGIRDEEAQRPMSFGLNQGQTLEETDPEGSTRRVRVLPAPF